MDSGSYIWPLLLTASTTGLMGSLHCLGMCGGISATVALASPPAPLIKYPLPAPRVALVNIPTLARTGERRVSSASVNVVAFNAGRIFSYAVAGAMAGTMGGALAGLGGGWVIGGTMTARTALFLFANLMIIFTGLYLMGLPQFLAPLERAGGYLWRRISPWSKTLLPLKSPTRAVLFGMLWGWIPCGMVYAMLLTAISAGSAAGGAMTMFAFGIGTLPVMVGAGWSAGQLREWTRKPRVRLAAGLGVVALGTFGVARTGSLEQLREFGALCMSLVATVRMPGAAP